MSSIYQRVASYFVDSYNELRKVIWPTTSQTVRATLLVVAISLVLAAILGGFDFLFSSLLQLLLGIS